MSCSVTTPSDSRSSLEVRRPGPSSACTARAAPWARTSPGRGRRGPSTGATPTRSASARRRSGPAPPPRAPPPPRPARRRRPRARPASRRRRRARRSSAPGTRARSGSSTRTGCCSPPRRRAADRSADQFSDSCHRPFDVEPSPQIAMATCGSPRACRRAPRRHATGYAIGRCDMTVHVLFPYQSPMWLLPSRPRV